MTLLDYLVSLLTDPLTRRLDRLEALIMAIKDDLKLISDRVAEEARRDTEAFSSIKTVVDGMAAKLIEMASLATDLTQFKADITASADQLRKNSDATAALALQNTPLDPNAPPVPAP